MSVKSKLTAIADDIREILQENSGMTLDEMATKLDEVKEQIVEAITAANAVTGNVTTLPEMSQQVESISDAALTWAGAAMQTAKDLNGEDFSDLLAAGKTYTDEELVEAYAQELQAMKNVLKASYTAIAAKSGTVPSEQYMKNLAAAINTISGSGDANSEMVLQWFSVTISLLNIVNAVDMSSFDESDAYSDETINIVYAHTQEIVSAMERITAAITDMGGVAPSIVAVENFPAAIRTIPAGNAWYELALELLEELNGFDRSTIADASNSEAMTVMQDAAAQAKTDLTAAYTTITENGGTMPEKQTIANLPAAIESMPPSTGANVQRYEGTFTTDTSGKATIWTTGMPFKPDVFVITGLQYSGRETQMAFVFPESVSSESGYTVQAATWTDEYEYGLEARFLLLWDGAPSRMEITMYKYSASGSMSAVQGETFSYAVIKYT